jgi:hypothetical protein
MAIGQKQHAETRSDQRGEKRDSGFSWVDGREPRYPIDRGPPARSLPRDSNKQRDMKTTILSVACALVVAGAFADEKVVTTTTSSTGTIERYEPGTTFVVKESTGPMTYRYGKTVTYVTKKGRVLTDDDVKTRVRVGAPVTVHYANEGETRVINRVEVDDDDDD